MYVYINETGKNSIFRTVDNAVIFGACVRITVVSFKM